jgi:hypothetical protein
MTQRLILAILAIPLHAAAQSATASLEGSIINAATNAPAPPARIKLAMRGSEPSFTTSDAKGHFRFDHLATGAYTLQIDCPGFLEATNNARFSLAINREVNLNSQVSPLTIQLTPAAIITGKLTSPRNLPIPTAQILLMTPGSELNRGIAGAPPMRQLRATATDDRGQFRFANLPPGTYYVAAEKHGLAGTVAAYRTTFSPAATELPSATKFELTGGARVTADIRVSDARAYRVSGKVALPPGLAPPDKLMIRIALSPSYTPITPEQPLNTMTQTAQFEIKGVAPGSYSMNAEAISAESPFHPVAALSRTIEVTQKDLSLDLPLVALPDIKGTIRVSGTCSPTNWRVQARGGSVIVAAIVTADGTFVLQNLRPASLRVAVTSRQFTPVKIESILLGTRDVSAGFDYPPANDATLTIQSACPPEGSSR